MTRPRQKRAALLSCGTVLLLLLIPVSLTAFALYRQHRQERLNQVLIAAVRRNDTTAVVSLLNQGADANASDRPAVREGLWTTLLRVFHRLPSVSRFPNALHLALGQGCTTVNVDMMDALLQHGSDVNVQDDQGMTVLMRALAWNEVDVANALLSHSPNWGLHDKYGNTTLVYAIRSGNSALMHRVLDAGASIQDRFGEDQCPITFAIYTEGTEVPNSLAIVDLLLDRGVDVNAHDQNGETMLMLTAESGDAEMVGDLLKRRAKASLRMTDGETALDLVHDAMKDKDAPFYSLASLKKVEAILKQAPTTK